MILYLVTILTAMIFVSLIVSIVMSMTFWSVFKVTGIAVVAVILVDAIVATAARLLPAKFADHDKKIFKVSAKEKKLYEKLKIRKWKDLVPEIGHLTGFRKNKLENPQDIAYIERFLLESCYGEIGHISSVVLGFLILLIFPISRIWFLVAIPVAIINGLMNLPSFFILRYNSYKLEVLKKSCLKKQKRIQSTADIVEERSENTESI